MLITETKVEKAKQLVKKSQDTRLIIVQSQSPNYNRSLIEYGKFDYLLFPETPTELRNKKDRIKQLDLGFSSVIGRIATKNKVSLLIDLESIRKLETKQKALVLGRLKEIIKIARKTKTNIKIRGYNDAKDSNSLFLELGANSQQMRISA